MFSFTPTARSRFAYPWQMISPKLVEIYLDETTISIPLTGEIKICGPVEAFADVKHLSCPSLVFNLILSTELSSAEKSKICTDKYYVEISEKFCISYSSIIVENSTYCVYFPMFKNFSVHYAAKSKVTRPKSELIVHSATHSATHSRRYMIEREMTNLHSFDIRPKFSYIILSDFRDFH